MNHERILFKTPLGVDLIAKLTKNYHYDLELPSIILYCT